MSSRAPITTVALIDPLWIGHHPMYFAQFTAAFLRLGARVIGLCPDPEAALADGMRAAEACNIRDASGRLSMHHLPSGKRSWFRGRFEGDPLRTFQRWRRAEDALTQAEELTGWKTDLVFFPYLDSYLRFLPFSLVPELTIGRPFAGLYLRNHHHGETPGLRKSLRLLAKGDLLLRSRLCRAIGVLDERFNDPIARYTGREVHPFPDVTDTVLPDRPSSLSQRVREKAAGRKIIGLIGLEKRKGMMTMLRAAEIARHRQLPWYFVFAGKFGRDLFTPSDLETIDSVAGDIRSGESMHIHFDPEAGRIPDEADFNDLFQTFDVAWAAYEGFEGSSGTLSKAAAFGIPVVATEGECIGGRVERYRTGVNIPEGDAERAVDAIRTLLDGLGPDGRPLDPDYAAYREDHGTARLDSLLAGLLRSPISTGA